MTNERCPVCAGTGWIEGPIDDLGHASGRWCRYCSGSGRITIERHEPPDHGALRAAVTAKLARAAAAEMACSLGYRIEDAP